jgi:hypothetical protein
MLGQRAIIGIIGDEAAQVNDAAHVGVLGSRGDVAGRGPVGVAEAWLTDRVDQVVDDVDLTGSRESRANRLRVGASRRTGVTSSNQPIRSSRAGSRVAVRTSWPSASSAVTSRDPI